MEYEKKIANEKEKNKRVALNIASSLLYNVAIMAFGLIIPRLYLVSFGSEVNGLVNTVKQIFFYMVLLEAGVGAASQQALYSPVAKRDINSINSILSATHNYYYRTGIVYMIISFVFATVYPIFVQTELPYYTVFIIVILYAIPEVLRYLVQGKYRIFLEVEGKAYILNNISTAMLIISNALRLVMLLFSDNLLLIQATYCLPSVIQLGIVVWYIRRNYKWINLKAKPNLSALKQKNSVLVHQVAGVFFSNTDVVILSTLCGFKEASIYTIYMLFYNNIDKFIRSFTDGISFRLGQLFHVDREKFIRLYNMYESVYFIAMFACYTVIATFLLPIITLYTQDVNDANYVSTTLIILFTAVNILINIKTPPTQLITYSGEFDSTKHQAIIELVLNISVSIIATLFLGIYGCLIGTIVALLYRSNALILFTCKKVLKISCFKTYKRIIANIIVATVILFLLGTQSCEPIGYIHVCLQALLNSLWIFAAFVGVNIIVDFNTFKSLPEFVGKIITKKITKK